MQSGALALSQSERSIAVGGAVTEQRSDPQGSERSGVCAPTGAPNAERAEERHRAGPDTGPTGAEPVERRGGPVARRSGADRRACDPGRRSLRRRAGSARAEGAATRRAMRRDAPERGHGPRDARRDGSGAEGAEGMGRGGSAEGPPQVSLSGFASHRPRRTATVPSGLAPVTTGEGGQSGSPCIHQRGNDLAPTCVWQPTAFTQTPS